MRTREQSLSKITLVSRKKIIDSKVGDNYLLTINDNGTLREIIVNTQTEYKFTKLHDLVKQQKLRNINIGIYDSKGKLSAYRFHFNKRLNSIEDSHVLLANIIGGINSIKDKKRVTLINLREPVLIEQDNSTGKMVTYPCYYVIK